jgi:hypothetical protein
VFSPSTVITKQICSWYPKFSVKSNFNCSYMAMSSFNIYSGFFCEIFSDSLFHLGILWDKNHIKIFCLEIWVERAVIHYIERGPPKDHPSQICFNLVQRFQRRRFKCDLLSKYSQLSLSRTHLSSWQWVDYHIFWVFLWNFSFNRFILIIQIRHTVNSRYVESMWTRKFSSI